MPRTAKPNPVAIDVPWSGIRQHTLEELETSLCELAATYAARPDLRRFCRDEAIRAKERARWASRNMKVDEAKRRLKAEMTEWLLVWLDDPGMFTEWVKLRRVQLREHLNSEER